MKVSAWKPEYDVVGPLPTRGGRQAARSSSSSGGVGASDSVTTAVTNSSPERKASGRCVRRRSDPARRRERPPRRPARLTRPPPTVPWPVGRRGPWRTPRPWPIGTLRAIPPADVSWLDAVPRPLFSRSPPRRPDTKSARRGATRASRCWSGSMVEHRNKWLQGPVLDAKVRGLTLGQKPVILRTPES